ncbi:MAG TPA: Calx-beta domain-containing protein [Pyrinomonadaceae bacterium]|nr:Calx-beta domain-containing protein [Pyrinomonadaceae bacterium]
MTSRPRIVFFALAAAVAIGFVCLRSAETQSSLRRITNTTDEGISINPSISGDGRIIGFESTEDVAGAGGTNHFRAIRANISVDPPTFFQMGRTRAVAPGVSQDGSRVAFASKDDPLGTNADGNSEIFLFNGSNLVQVTNTTPGNPANRVTEGNFQPSMSDDGRFVAFSSNRNLTSQNGDGNLEVFVFDSTAAAFTQLTNSTGIVGFSDAKISGDGSAIACIRDLGATASTNRDLLRINRTSAAQTVLSLNVTRLAMTYGRAISDDGARVAYSAETAANSTQVFYYDGRIGNVNRQVTTLGTRVTEVPLHPTISGDGLRIAFATRRALTGFSNSDASVELYTYDTPTGTFARITNVVDSDADCFDGSNAACEVVSSLNDDGSTVVFNFPRALSGTVTAGLENKSEIYATGLVARPPFGALTSILNQASLGHEPSPIKAVAPNSIAAAFGTVLANTTQQSQKQPNGEFPTNVGGTTVTVNGRAAQIFFVSPTRVHFLVPDQTEIGNAEVVVTNADGFASKGTVPVLVAAPGIFTKTGDGVGEGQILNTETQAEGPFDPSGGNLRLSIFSTGVRKGVVRTVNIGGRVVTPEAVIESPEMPGLDEVVVRVPADLRGAGNVTLFIQADGRDSNPVTVRFLGDSTRNVVINEVLADPPEGIAGDANHDGVRDGTDDEFVELVNGTSGEVISLGGWTIRTRATGSTTETTRFTFASGTSLPPGEAIVVFGGGSFNSSDAVFGCAQVVKATTTAGLSLTNSGVTILVRDASGNLITEFSYGGSTGRDGDNNQSLTRSPDITGAYVQHTAAVGASGRYSPGLRTDGTPFGNCPGILTTVTISPPSATIGVGQTQQFTAQAFDQFGRVMTGVPIDFISDNTNVAFVESVSLNFMTGVATATVKGQNPGIANITASATNGSNTASSTPAALTVSGPALSINDVSQNEGNAGTTIFTFTVSLSTTSVAPVTFDIATQDNTATVANNDYAGQSLTAQSIPPGLQTYQFKVTVNGDVSMEPTEVFFVNVSNVSGASVTDAQGTGTIVTDDIPLLTVNDVTREEGNAGTTTFTFTVSSNLPAPPEGITFDIATQDSSATVANSDYVARSLTSQSIPSGQFNYTFDVTVNGDTTVESNEEFFVNISNVSANAGVADGQGLGTIQNDDASGLVISQVYGGGNNAGAPFRNDFVEIYNRGTTTVDFAVTPHSIQYAAVGSNFGSQTNLTSGSIAPGKYYLVQEGGGTTNGVALPAPDAIGTIAMGNTAGKVALVAGTAALPAAACPGDDLATPFNPNNSTIVDFVGYGNSPTTTGHCYEGAAPAAAPSNTTADFRKAGGCVDTNENGADFFVASPNPRNSSSPAGNCQPEITINDVTVTEGNVGTVNATFTVSLSSASAQTVTVNFVTADGTATLAGNDYQTNSGMLTFNPGDLTQTITVLVNGDTLDEASENFFVNLSGATNAVLLDSQGQGTISDNDPAPSLSINDLSIAEGDSGTTAFTFTVTLSTASGQTVTVNFATADNTASSASDYQSNSGLLTFVPGDTAESITVLVNGDGTFEPNETFFVNLSIPTNASISDAQGQGTITNDDAAPPTPTLFIDDLVNIAEGDSGTSVVTFTVTLTPTSSNTVTVDYTTANVTASDSSDYVATSGQLSFAPGETSKPINVTINGDMLVEPDETFRVNLSNSTGGAGIAPPGFGTGTIKNDDTANLVISQVYGGGNNSGATFKNDYIEIFNRGTTTVDLAGWSVQQASATGTSWSVTQLCPLGPCLIAPGKYFLVKESPTSPTIGADLPTPDATGTSNLATSGGKIALVNNSTALTGGGCPFAPSIVDLVGYGGADCAENSAPAPAHSNTTADVRKLGGCQDTNDNAADFLVSAPFPRNSSSPANSCTGGATPNLTITDVTVAEGNSGTAIATFTVSLSAPAQGTDVTFDIATADGTAQDDTPATEDNDYVAKTSTNQIIPAGQTTYTFSVTVNGDVAVEPDETFFVNITNVLGATVSDGQGLGTIQHDDLPTLSINDVSQAETNSGTTTFTFTVSLSAPAPATVSFDIATADGTAQDDNPATEDNDYQLRSLTAQTIAQGGSSYTFDVTVNGDTADEGVETFFVNVSNVSGATVLDGQGLGTIQNDDAPPTLSIGDVTQVETNAGTTTFTFTVSLSAPALAGGVSFTVNTADGTTDPATAGSDYVAIVNGSGSIAEGNTSTTVDVTVNGDTVFESNETFFVNITGVTGATVSDGQGLGTITNDDTQPSLAIADAIITEGNAGTSLMTFTVTLTGTSQSTVSVNYATADSSATVANTDYDTASGTLNFVSGDTAETFTVTIHGDVNPEGDEMFLVNLSGASGATISDSQALGIIFLDDPFSIAAVNTAYSENFDVLAQSGVSATTPPAWPRAESGTSANSTYTANDGGSTTGDTYSYGTGTSTERALGGLQTGTLVPTIGAFYRNDTGATLNSLQISYTGEQWRLGTASRTDQLDFQYSTNATSLTTGTWTDVNALDFTTPNTTTAGAKDGNNAANRTAITNTITGLSIAPGATFWIRWTDFNASGADDGLAVDDFSITAGVDTPALSINNVTQAETNSGTTTFNFTVSLTSPAPPGGVSFTINTADGTTDPANAGSDYVAIINGSGSIAQNGTSTTISVTVNGDTDIEPNETFFVNLTGVTGATVTDAQGLGTITNDDAATSTTDLSVTKTDALDPVAIGNDITYTITVTNGGPAVASNTQLSDTVPTNTTFRSISAPVGWTCGTVPAVGGTGAISCTNATFGVGSAVFTLVVRVGTAVADGTIITNTASVSSSTTESNPGNESAIQTTTVKQPQLAISQVYGGGGNASATYTNDFIEIFNRGTTTVDFSATNYSVQYAAATSNFTTNKTDITSGTIAPGQYFLIQQASGGANGVALPTPDATGSIAMSATAGKVALVLGTTALTGSGCPFGATIVDFLGYGTTANCSETAPIAMSGTNSNARSAIRTVSCTDINNNSTDFSNPTTPPVARNSATTLAPCP